MSRDEEASLNVKAQEAKRRLRHGIESRKGLVAQYRAKLLALRMEDETSKRRLAIASASLGRG